jgi:hypothetical protein
MGNSPLVVSLMAWCRFLKLLGDGSAVLPHPSFRGWNHGEVLEPNNRDGQKLPVLQLRNVGGYL